MRFAFGGTVTAFAGIIAKLYGPQIGGLFLAFPAIFPAAATLVQQHQKREKERAGESGVIRGRMAAGADAAGTAMGTVGLMAFAAMVWFWLPNNDSRLILCVATLAWFLVAFLIWLTRETLARRLRLLFRHWRSGSELAAGRHNTKMQRR
jgi:Protein of unknown function (DUF3147)